MACGFPELGEMLGGWLGADCVISASTNQGKVTRDSAPTTRSLCPKRSGVTRSAIPDRHFL